MSHSSDFPISWEYPSTGPAPPTPVVVNTVPKCFACRPMPSPTPSRGDATPTIDDDAPCPPSPRYIPSSELGWSNTLNFGTSQSTLTQHTSELDDPTVFVDEQIDLTSNDHAQYVDPMAPHVSDHLIYAREIYAYPSPILTMIKRATLDLDGRRMQSVDPLACGQPFKLFSLTAGYVPLTGLEMHDEQSFRYYVTPPLFEESDLSLSHCYSVGTIRALQRELCAKWLWVYPQLIPPVIIRQEDLVGPYNLNPRNDGCAFVVPTNDSIWATICQRGIDCTFRPIHPSATVETGICSKGDALYLPQHIVASKFAVNVFVELPDFAGANSRCEYLGAYVLQVMDGLTITRSMWAIIDPEVQRSVFNRVPHHFEGFQHPSHGWPHLPYVQFCYYMWDQCFLGMLGEFCIYNAIRAARDETEDESINSDERLDFLDLDFDTDQVDRGETYPAEPDYTSFLDLSSCE